MTVADTSPDTKDSGIPFKQRITTKKAEQVVYIVMYFTGQLHDTHKAAMLMYIDTLIPKQRELLESLYKLQ